MVQRRRAATALLVLSLMAWQPGAAAQTPAGFGALRPGMSPVEAMAATPDLQWEPMRRGTSGETTHAVAWKMLEFAGDRWSASAGGAAGTAVAPRRGLIMLNRMAAHRRPEDCLAAMSRALKAMEAQLGPFGGQADFGDPAATTYGFASGRAFTLEPAGESSLVRAFAERDGERYWITFRSPAGDGIRASAMASADNADRTCQITLSQWVE